MRKGTRHSNKTIAKMRNRQCSKKTRRKLSKASKGRILTKKHKEKIRLAIKGRPNFLVRGKLCGLWKGGITPLARLIRRCFKYRQWRSDVLTRDDFTCVLCNKRSGQLEIDHYPDKFSDIFHRNKIKSFKQALSCEEFWNINNGRTLCYTCHNLTKHSKSIKKG